MPNCERYQASPTWVTSLGSFSRRGEGAIPPPGAVLAVALAAAPISALPVKIGDASIPATFVLPSSVELFTFDAKLVKVNDTGTMVTGIVVVTFVV